MSKMNAILVTLTQQAKNQNESIERCYTTINEVLPILSSAFEVMKEVISRERTNKPTDSSKDEKQMILNHISQALTFIKDRNELLVTNQRILTNLMGQQSEMLTQGINSLLSNNEY